MKRTSLPWNLKQLARMNEKGSLNFTYPIQRKSGQWDELQKSLLIHSIASDYPVPAILILKGDINYVLDGKQRVTTLIDFMKNEYVLHEDTPDIRIEDIGEEFEVAGLYFDDLPEAVRDEITTKNLTINRIEEATDEEIEELFSRWNNGTPLTKQQKTRSIMGVNKAIEIEKLESHNFMRNKTGFTALQRRRSDDEAVILQTLMLLSGYDYKDFVANTILDFSKEMREMDLSAEFEEMNNILDYMNEAFETKQVLFKKLHLPMVFTIAKKAMESNLDKELFVKWVEDFALAISRKKQEPMVETDYKTHTGAGSVKKDKVQGRLEEMEKHYNAVIEQIKEDLPEEEVVEEVETIEENQEPVEEAQEVEEVEEAQEDPKETDENEIKELEKVDEDSQLVAFEENDWLLN